MQQPLEISFRGDGATPLIRDRIEKEIAKLERYCKDIISCHVHMDFPNPPVHDKIHHVRIDVIVPGAELVVGREPPKRQSHKDPFIAIRDAFLAMRRKLRDYSAQRSREVKRHGDILRRARITRLMADGEYGFLENIEGTSVYFHRNAVSGEDFNSLQVGQEVRYSEAQGEQGPQATVVTPVGKEGKHLMDNHDYENQPVRKLGGHR